MMKFLKEWGLFLFIIIAILLSRVFLWSLVVVDGHSMDPTLADKERLVIVRKSTINRFDIVVAKEETADGSTKDIVKRVIGMPGDTIKFDHDQLTINNKVYPENYLKDLNRAFNKCPDLVYTYIVCLYTNHNPPPKRIPIFC